MIKRLCKKLWFFRKKVEKERKFLKQRIDK